MNENLVIDFTVLLNDKSIKNITRESNLVINALKKCSKV